MHALSVSMVAYSESLWSKYLRIKPCGAIRLVNSIYGETVLTNFIFTLVKLVLYVSFLVWDM